MKKIKVILYSLISSLSGLCKVFTLKKDTFFVKVRNLIYYYCYCIPNQARSLLNPEELVYHPCLQWISWGLPSAGKALWVQRRQHPSVGRCVTLPQRYRQDKKIYENHTQMFSEYIAHQVIVAIPLLHAHTQCVQGSNCVQWLVCSQPEISWPVWRSGYSSAHSTSDTPPPLCTPQNRKYACDFSCFALQIKSIHTFVLLSMSLQ